MTKKYILDIDLDYDFLCFGISCHHKDYRVSWNINDALHIKLSKEPSIKISDELSNEVMEFSKFTFNQKRTGCLYTLLNNRNKWGFLLPELYGMDYVLMVRSEIINEPILIDKLRSLNIVLSISKVEPASLKNKERLLL